jgi:hypothetical protein
VATDGITRLRAALKAALRRGGAVISEPLDARLTALSAVVEELRAAIEGLPASEASVASATEAALVLSRAAQVVESPIAALAPATTGEVVISAAAEEAERLEKALAGWAILGRRSVGSLVVVRAKLP